MIPEHKLEAFMRESNAIEGEYEIASYTNLKIKKMVRPLGRLNIGDMEAIKYFLRLKTISQKSILYAHQKMFKNRMDDAGSYRQYNVRVGDFFPVEWQYVKEDMGAFMVLFQSADSWTAHNLFERVHPFGDGNGRMGRLLWLWKAYHEEGYRFQLSFLHKYYYQTLGHLNKL